MTHTNGPATTPPPGMLPPVPPGTPAGSPSLRQTVLLFVAAGVTAGGACAGFIASGPGSGALAFLFFVSVPVAAGAFALLVFRLWRRRAREAWPSLAQCLAMAAAGVGLGIGGCGGFLAAVDSTWDVPGMVLGAVFVVGAAIALGAGELFLIGIARLIMKRPGAR